MIEVVKLRKTLKSGKDVWLEGIEFKYPNIPPDILSEALLGTGTVEVIKEKEDFISNPAPDGSFHVTRVGSVITDNFFKDEEFSPNSPVLSKRGRQILRSV